MMRTSFKLFIAFISLFAFIQVSCSNGNQDKADFPGQSSHPKKKLSSPKAKPANRSKASSMPRAYSLKANINVRITPKATGKIICKIRNNYWFDIVSKEKQWLKIKLNTGQTGYVLRKHMTDKWLLILKKERKLYLMQDRKKLAAYSVGLGFDPVGDKVKYGDGCTANGRFYVCEMLDNPKPKKRYGARSLRLSYPNLDDARRGLKDKLINRSQYKSIVKSIFQGKTPLQNTTLGGSLRIHGGGAGQDWTLGCIALNDQELIQLYSKLPQKNTMTEIYQSERQYQQFTHPLFTNRIVLKGAKKLITEGAEYTREAMAAIRIDFPMGDFNKKIGVCTDIIIRALRFANIDIQALLHEDLSSNPSRYKTISRPNTNLDHRRVRNLKYWLDTYTISLSIKAPNGNNHDWQPGDIVLMDTGVNNASVYDHIGIVSDVQVNGRPAVINLWAVGSKTNHMDLLDGRYPKIVGHYRFRHIFDYTVIQ